MMHDHGHKRLVDEVAERLREMIYTGEYVPGDRLRQESLAAELQISRTPLREALRMLERDGLVVVSPSRGVQVAAADRARLLSAYEVREVLDGLAARLAAQRCTYELEMQLRRQLEMQEVALRPWNARFWTRLNVAFHATIVEHSGNPVLLQQLSLIRLTAQVFYPELLLDPLRAAEALDEHRQIAGAVCRCDGEGAEAAARAHVRRTLLALRAAAVEGASAPVGKEEGRSVKRPRRARAQRAISPSG